MEPSSSPLQTVGTSPQRLDARDQVVVVLEDHRRTDVIEQPRVGGRALEDGTARRERALEHHESAALVDGVVEVSLHRRFAGLPLGGRVKTGNLWTAQHRQFPTAHCLFAPRAKSLRLASR